MMSWTRNRAPGFTSGRERERERETEESGKRGCREQRRRRRRRKDIWPCVAGARQKDARKGVRKEGF